MARATSGTYNSNPNEPFIEVTVDSEYHRAVITWRVGSKFMPECKLHYHPMFDHDTTRSMKDLKDLVDTCIRMMEDRRYDDQFQWEEVTEGVWRLIPEEGES